MRLLKNIFKKKKKIEPAENSVELLRKNLLSEIAQDKTNIKNLLNKKADIQKSAKELIAELFFVPSDYWYDEWNRYDEIKQHPENAKTDASLKEKTDTLLHEYEEQVLLCETKISFFRSLIQKHEKALEKIEYIIKESAKAQNKKSSLNTLKKHKEKLDAEQKNDRDLETIIENVELFKALKLETAKAEENFLIQKKVREYIARLTDIYENTNDFDTAILREETDKLKKQINKDETPAE